jgi:hypothetical protein
MRTAILAAACLTLSTAAAMADDFSCPALNSASGKPLVVSTLSVFRGPPSEQEDLVPDNEDAKPNEPYYWTFDADEGPAPIWVACSYKGSKKTRQFVLPKAFKKCSVLGKFNAGSGVRCE